MRGRGQNLSVIEVSSIDINFCVSVTGTRYRRIMGES